MRTSPINPAILLSAVISLSVITFVSCQRGNDDDVQTVAGFTYSSQGQFPVKVVFSNTSVDPPAGGPSVYHWDFGDGASSTEISPTHFYTSGGTYTVLLTQAPATGTIDSLEKTLTLSVQPGPSGTSNRLNTANFSAAISFSSYRVSFVNTSTNGIAYQWAFGDGDFAANDSTTVTHVYTAGGPYHAVLQANGPDMSDTSGAVISFQ